MSAWILSNNLKNSEMKTLKSIFKLLLHTALIAVIILLWIGIITLYP